MTGEVVLSPTPAHFHSHPHSKILRKEVKMKWFEF